jgi:hypothetical protein
MLIFFLLSASPAVPSVYRHTPQRIDLSTRLELLLGADYFWQETGPAVRLEVDGRAFILAKKEEWDLLP